MLSNSASFACLQTVPMEAVHVAAVDLYAFFHGARPPADNAGSCLVRRCATAAVALPLLSGCFACFASLLVAMTARVTKKALLKPHAKDKGFCPLWQQTLVGLRLTFGRP